MHACLNAEQGLSEQRVGYFGITNFTVLEIFLFLFFVPGFGGIYKFIFKVDSRVQEHVVAGIKVSENSFVIADLARVVVGNCDRWNIVVINGIDAFADFGELAHVHFVVAVMDFCAECQVLDGVEFHSAAVRARFDDNPVWIRLELANGRVERVQQDLVRRVVRVVDIQIVYFEERFACPESPSDNRLEMHAVHRDVASAEWNLRGIATQGKVGRVRHGLVFVRLRKQVGMACHSEVKSDGIRD